MCGREACVAGGVCGGGACVAGGVHGRGHVWQGVRTYVARGHVWWGAFAYYFKISTSTEWHAIFQCKHSEQLKVNLINGGGMHDRGHVWQGVCGGGACMAGGVRGTRDGHCSRRYASYWNAFLFQINLRTTRALILIWGRFILHDLPELNVHKKIRTLHNSCFKSCCGGLANH